MGLVVVQKMSLFDRNKCLQSWRTPNWKVLHTSDGFCASALLSFSSQLLYTFLLFCFKLSSIQLFIYNDFEVNLFFKLMHPYTLMETASTNFHLILNWAEHVICAKQFQLTISDLFFYIYFSQLLLFLHLPSFFWLLLACLHLFCIIFFYKTFIYIFICIYSITSHIFFSFIHFVALKTNSIKLIIYKKNSKERKTNKTTTTHFFPLFVHHHDDEIAIFTIREWFFFFVFHRCFHYYCWFLLSLSKIADRRLLAFWHHKIRNSQSR